MPEEMEVQTQSLELSEAEVHSISGEQDPVEVARTPLPSDAPQVDFSKYEGVSREDIIRQMEASRVAPPQVEEVPEVKPEPKDEGVITDEIFDEYANKYSDNGGKLSDEDYAALEAKGIDKKTITERIDYEIYKTEKALKEGLSPYGKAEDVPTAIEWARANWSESQKNAFNAAVEGSDGVARYAIVGGLLQQFASANRQGNGTPIHGKGMAPESRTAGYATKTDYIKDANSTSYDKDPGYRAQVEAKLAATDMNNWYKGIPKGI